MTKKISAVLVALVAFGLIVAGTAAGGGKTNDGPANGTFETGSFKSWTVDDGAYGDWFAYDSSTPFFPPVDGAFAAGAAQYGPSVMILTQKFRLKQSKPAVLSFWLAYVEDFCPICGPCPIICTAPVPKGSFNTQTPAPRCAPDVKIPCGGDWCTPETVDLSDCNQQLRVDILKANANPKTFADKDILETLFLTEDGVAPPFLDWTPMYFDVSEYAGRNIKLRFLVIAGAGPLLAAIDGVRIYHDLP